jgi:hypothetical protein
MLISFVLVAEGMVAGQPLLQRLQTVCVSVGSWVVDIQVDVLAIGGTFLLDGSSDQGLDVGDVGSQSDQGDDDAVTLLGAVLEEDVGGEFVDGQLDVKACFVCLKGKKESETREDDEKERHASK